MHSELTPENPYSIKYDLNNCDKEPIHLIQTVQSFACILVADVASLVITKVSSNVSDFLRASVKELLGSELTDLFSSDIIASFQKGISAGTFIDLNPMVLPVEAGKIHPLLLAAHISNQQLVIEIEQSHQRENTLQVLNKVDIAIQRIQLVTASDALFDETAKQVKQITGYDRVMVYRFDEANNGEVVAESKEDHLEPFLGLRYPHTDIPQQARALYLSNRVRILNDVDDNLAMIRSLDAATNQPQDLSMCASRGVSPIHLEYLRNMGVRASMSVAIIEDERLWGLIACHHYSDKKALDYHTRNLIRFMGQILSGHLSLSRAHEYRGIVLRRNKIHVHLFENMNNHRDITEGLTTGQYTLLDYIPSSGAMLVIDNKITALGEHPTYGEMMQIVDWLNEINDSYLFATDSMAERWPEAATFSQVASGLLSIKISETASEYIVWFRSSQEIEVIWAGNPTKSVERSTETGRLSPRKSFEAWKELIQNRSAPWLKAEKDAAIQMRNDIKDVLIRRFEELKKLHHDLSMSYKELESFSYTVSHDLRSPLRGIEGFSQILLEDYANKLDDYGIQVINTIVSSVSKMNSFINDILSLSKIANEHLAYENLEMDVMMEQIIKDCKTSIKKSDLVSVRIEKLLPNLLADKTLIRQLFSNLIANAIKYSRSIDNAEVVISGSEREGYKVYQIRDNGVGFDMKYADKVFEVFNRLFTDEEYEGTGIGLSIVKRVIERHQGRITVESTPGKGTTFEVFFPV